MKMNKKGFTIVELVIVIAVIAILAGVMIPTFGGVIDSANKTAAQQEATNVYKQMCAKQENIELGSAFTNKNFYIVIDDYVFEVEGGVVEYNANVLASSLTDPTTTYGTYEGATIYEAPASSSTTSGSTPA